MKTNRNTGTSKILKNEIIDDLEVLAKDYYVATIKRLNDKLAISFLPGQTFAVEVYEERL